MGHPNQLYFIDRGHDKPEGWKVEHHRYILCTDAARAYQEAGWTGAGATMWHKQPIEQYGGWLLVRWHGLDIDYGHLVRGCDLWGGGKAGFWHRGQGVEPYCHFPRAVWWSDKAIPRWLEEIGVKPPADAFSRERVAEETYMPRPAKRRYVVAEDVLGLGDWLEERGFAEAAAAFRREFDPRVRQAERVRQADLFTGKQED